MQTYIPFFYLIPFHLISNFIKYYNTNINYPHVFTYHKGLFVQLFKKVFMYIENASVICKRICNTIYTICCYF